MTDVKVNHDETLPTAYVIFSLGVFWATWAKYGFWWGVLYFFVWPFQIGQYLATHFL